MAEMLSTRILPNSSIIMQKKVIFCMDTRGIKLGVFVDNENSYIFVFCAISDFLFAGGFYSCVQV